MFGLNAGTVSIWYWARVKLSALFMKTGQKPAALFGPAVSNALEPDAPMAY